MTQAFWDAQSTVISKQNQVLQGAKNRFTLVAPYFDAMMGENTASLGLSMSTQNYQIRNLMLQSHSAALRNIILEFRLKDLRFNHTIFDWGPFRLIFDNKTFSLEEGF